MISHYLNWFKLTFSLSLFDYLSTAFFISLYGLENEANPFMRHAFQYGYSPFLWVGVWAFVYMGMKTTEKYNRKNAEKFRRIFWVLWGLPAIYIFADYIHIGMWYYFLNSAAVPIP